MDILGNTEQAETTNCSKGHITIDAQLNGKLYFNSMSQS